MPCDLYLLTLDNVMPISSIAVPKVFYFKITLPYIQMINNTIRSSIIITILFAGVILLGLVFPLKAVYAHTLSGGENAAFLALVKILQADLHLVQSNVDNKYDFGSSSYKHCG
jgi:hypothetical protein